MSEQIDELAAAGRAASEVPRLHSPKGHLAGATNTEVSITIIGALLLACGLLALVGAVLLLVNEDPAALFAFLGGVSSAITSALVFGLAQILRHLRRMEGLLGARLQQAAKR